VIALGASLITGCANQALDDDRALYEELADSVDGALVIGALTTPFRAPEIAQNLVGTADEYAASATAAAPRDYLPAGCATATASGATMTLTFAHCRGPGVLRDVTGALSVTYSVGPPNCIDCQQPLAAADFASPGLHANGVDLVIDAAGPHVHGPRGHDFKMGGELTTTSLGACTTLDDTIWVVDGQYTNLNTQHYVSAWGFQRCAGACPIGNVWRHMSAIAGYVGGGNADPPLRYLGGDTVQVTTLSGTFGIDAHCD
jgi:hypothetical protein